jgi:hypothetical protein
MRRLRLAALAIGLAAFASSVAFLAAPGLLPWENATETDWIYPVVTRFATVEGHRVHYPTPTVELAAALEARSETPALRHLAEARLALGDRKGAVVVLERWAEATGPEAWAEAARWAASHLEMDLAFRSAEKALPGLAPRARRALADERITWAVAHPEAADPLALRKARAEAFADDPEALEDYLRALEKAGQLDAAEAALAGAPGLPAERRLLLRSDLLADHGQQRRAFEVLDAAVDAGFSAEARKAYAVRTDKGNPTAPEAWRASLERGFDAKALVRLAAYVQGLGRGDAASDLLRQVERRYEGGLDRSGFLLLARLWSEIDGVPEAFRARLAAAQKGTAAEQTGDIAPLAHLALQAGGRPLPWGIYNDEPYRWVARVDRTPGFWTGGVAFLLTGQDWKDALERLQTETLPHRTFATARALEAELARRAAGHADLSALRVAIMARHVERGEGKEALALLPVLEGGPTAVASEARRIALLALRQVEGPLAEELRLYRARLQASAPDGSRPETASVEEAYRWQPPPPYGETWRRVPRPERGESHHDVLQQAIARMEERDRSHRTTLDLLLHEMDRLPDAEDLWEELASRLEGWNLDDELGPRYERALERFEGPGIWNRAARWYARRSRQQDLRRLADEIAGRFRGAEVFARAQDSTITIEIPEQPRTGARARLVPWADWVRLRALERFPHSPTVFKEAATHLVARSRMKDAPRPLPGAEAVVVEDSLLEERRWALLFVDAERREEYFVDAMRKGGLEARLTQIEAGAEKTPVQDRILFEGWSRLSRFELAWAAADRLTASYPEDGALAGRVLSLHRSLAALDPSHAAPARVVVDRTAPAVTDPSTLWTELGELEEERGRPEAALAIWKKIVASDPRNPERLSNLAALLWDYGHMAEALAVVEEGRKAIGRPRFMAFETGVLREETKDVDGAVREYLASLEPEEGDCFCSWFEHDQRSLRRLAQLLRHERVRRRVLARIAALQPGARADEQVLASFFPMGAIELPDRVSEFDADDWIDLMDMPVDPVGRQQRAEQQAEARPQEREAIARVGQALFEKTLAMVPQATDAALLDAALAYFSTLPQPERAPHEVTFRSAVMARRAALAPSDEARVALEVERARYLFENGRREQADAVWASLADRVGKLPEGAARMRAEAERAAYLERSRGAAAAADEWQRLSAHYPWSLGILEDRLAFLARTGRGDEARAELEAVAPRAAAGHREALLERLARESLEARDLPRARRAVEQLLQGALDDEHRLGADHLLVRLSLRENAGFDPFTLAKAEAPKLKPEHEADLYAALARGAAAEGVFAQATNLWIEALNRRTERGWIGEACRAADKGGRDAALLEFFEKQGARSPRDVRWAVAVREIRLHRHDLAGAIEMAKSAVAVRPERESLWREAVDLLVRAGRIEEAADYLEGWQKPRPADEDAVRWRASLYARVGEADTILALERAAFAAFVRQAENDEERDRERDARKSRAVSRLRNYGYPRLAWRFLAPDDDVRKVASSPLGDHDQATLALATNNFVRLLRTKGANEDFRSSAAQALRDNGRPEQKEEVLAFLLGRLGPLPPAGAPVAFAGDVAALRLFWSFVYGSGMESQMRVALARRLLASSAGPWQGEPSFAFVESVGASVVTTRDSQLVFAHPDLDALWFRDLVRRDRVQELGAFLEPRVQDLLLRIRSGAPLGPPGDRALLTWAWWLDEEAVHDAWVRSLAARPERLADFAAVVSDRRQWDRLWVLAARRWKIGPLLTALPEDARTAWFRHWQNPSPRDPDPALRARGETIERVSVALGHLVSGATGAAGDPLIAKLRGRQTVGAVLGRDASWTWPEFAPRKNAAGAIAESRDDRVFGQGVDAGRLPGALWGERPGEAWYVLDALARLRSRDTEAPFVPLEVPQRGRESARALIAIRLADALGDPALAVALDEANPPSGADMARLAVRLRIALAAGQKDKAAAILQDEVRRLQGAMGEETFRAVRRLAEDHGLADPLSLLDPSKPVASALAAFLYDRIGPREAGRFQPADTVDFRAALEARWSAADATLDAPRVEYALGELWARGVGTLPRRSLRRLGGIWPHAADWLDQQPVSDRASSLEALRSLPDATRLFALMERQGREKEDVVRLLRVRVHLARDEDAEALALVDQMLAEVAKPETLALGTVRTATAESAEGAEEVESEYVEGAQWIEVHESDSEAPSDALAARLSLWLSPFRDAKRVDVVTGRFREALRARREESAVPVPSWALALELTTEARERAALLAELENAWIRGDWAPDDLTPLVETLAKQAPDATPRWLARWTAAFDYDHVARRARVLAQIEDGAGVHRVLVEGRPRGGWSAPDEARAFDLWRTLATPPAPPRARAASGKAAPADATPATWARALPFWKRKATEIGPDLARHLREHPFDLLAARAALRTVAPGEEQAMALATATLEDPTFATIGDPAGDSTFLRIRTARGLLPISLRAARATLGGAGAGVLEDLRKRRMGRAEIDATLADVAHLAANPASREAVIAQLEDRDPARARAVRAELQERDRPEGPPPAFRMVNGWPTPYRPRDLDWSVVTAALTERAR